MAVKLLRLKSGEDIVTDVKEYYGYNNEKARQALDILDDEQIEHIKSIINRGGKHGRVGVDSRVNARGDVK